MHFLIDRTFLDCPVGRYSASFNRTSADPFHQYVSNRFSEVRVHVLPNVLGSYGVKGGLHSVDEVEQQQYNLDGHHELQISSWLHRNRVKGRILLIKHLYRFHIMIVDKVWTNKLWSWWFFCDPLFRANSVYGQQSYTNFGAIFPKHAKYLKFWSYNHQHLLL